MELGQKLAGIARTINHGKGYTVEFDMPEGVYTSKHFDKHVYHTPENEDLRFGVGAHETVGKTRCFVHPEDEARVRAMFANIPV